MTIGAHDRPGSAGGEVLLVEDDAGDAVLVEELLTAAGSGLATTWATSLADAEARFGERTVCILLDLGLPDAVGLEGLRRLLALAGRVPVIVLTGRVDREAGEAAVAEGAQDYLVKGTVSGEELTRAIRYAIERRRGQESARQLAEAALVAKEKARLERGLLPRPIIRNRDLTWATRYQPGGGRALLGGDFFDGVEMDDGRVRVLVGDVTGHGPDEAALGVALRVAWRSLVLAGAPAEEVLRGMQRVLNVERHADDLFATVCDITLDPDLRAAEVRLAGHHPPLLLNGTGVQEMRCDARGPLLGLLDTAAWPAGRVELGREWGLVLFTDGIIEGRSAEGDRLEVTGLVRLADLTLAKSGGLADLADELIAGAELANGGPLPDDVALFLLATGARW